MLKSKQIHKPILKHKTTIKVEHYIRLYHAEGFPDSFTNLPVKTRTLTNILTNLTDIPSDRFRACCFYDVVCLIQGEQIKTGAPRNFSKLKPITI
jgi:hypothetical protein